MPRLDPADLRAYAARDWGVVDAATREDRARAPVAQKVALGVELYEAARRALPGWPDDDARRADLDHHLRLRRLLDRAARVGAR
jgi:hypothetical protein